MRAPTLSLLHATRHIVSALLPIAPLLASAGGPSVLSTGGTGNDVVVGSVGVGSRDVTSWSIGKDTDLKLNAVARLGYWHGLKHVDDRTGLWDVSLTPTLRFQPTVPYLRVVRRPLLTSAWEFI